MHTLCVCVCVWLSINKRNSEFTPNTDEKVCQGHKWGLLALWRYMRTEMGVDTDAVWQSITDLVIKTIIWYDNYTLGLLNLQNHLIELCQTSCLLVLGEGSWCGYHTWELYKSYKSPILIKSNLTVLLYCRNDYSTHVISFYF